jgi:hypothetical protein
VRSAGAFSYSGDPSTSNLDAVRFLIGDTDPNYYFLNDAEINYLLSTSASTSSDNQPDVPSVAGAAAETIAANLSREISYSADGVSVSGDTLASKYFEVAEKIRTLARRTDVVGAPDVGGILVGEVYDDTIRPLVWAVGMHDNYLAGQQDFGGSYSPPAAWGADYYYGYYGSVAAEASQLQQAAAGRSAGAAAGSSGSSASVAVRRRD